MNKKLQKLIEPGIRLFLFIMAAFAVVTFFFNEVLAFIEAGVVVLLIIYSLIDARRRRKRLVDYLETVTYNAESAKNNTLLHFPLPIVVFNIADSRIIWGNQIFFNLFGSQQPSVDADLTDMVPLFNSRWLLEGKKQYPGLVQVGERRYQLHGNIVRSRDAEEGKQSDRGFMGITYWVDVTDYDNIKTEYENSRPVTTIFVIDNYEELMKESEQVYAYRRDNGMQSAAILVNFSGEEAPYDPALTKGAKLLLSSCDGPHIPGVLQPYEAAVYAGK